MNKLQTKTISKKAFSFLLIAVMIDSTGLGIITPVLPQLVAETTGSTFTEAAKLNGLLFAIYALMHFLFAPIMGGLSDRFGRRPVLLLSLLGLGIDYIFLALAPTYFWMIVGRSISGIFGSSFTSAIAYVADLTEPKSRAANFGLIGAAFGFGFIIGPAIGGLVSSFGLRTPFYLAACLSLVNVVYGYLVLKESLSLENRRKFNLRRANPLGSIMLLRQKPSFLLLFTAYFFFSIAYVSVQSTWNIYTIQKFNWTPSTIGWSLAAVGVAIATVQGGLIGYFSPKWGAKKSVIIGILFSIVGLVGFSIAPSGWTMFMFMIPFAIGGFVEPSIKATLSENTVPSEQGEIQGAFASLLSLAQIISPLLMTGVYYYTVNSIKSPFYGSPYLLASAILVFTIILTIKGFTKISPIVSPKIK